MMSRKKLADLGIKLPLIPTTSVGSLPKSDKLLKARTSHAKGKLSDQDLRKLEDEATEFWIRKQEELDVDVLVDGEQYRGDMVEYFARNIDGFAISGLVRSYGNRYYHKPIINGKVRWREPITVERWKAAQKLTRRPVKGMLTGPYTIMDWSFNEHYPDRRAATFALAGEIRKEVEALIRAGAKIIQIDEPALSVRFEEVPTALAALGQVTRGLEAYFITHCCYGEFEKIYDKILDLPVDNLDIEMSNSNLDLLRIMKETPFTRDVSFGLVDVHTHKIESGESVRKRLEQALTALKPEQVWADPDCGLKTRSVDEGIAKLKAVVDAAKQVRKELRQPARS
jgi:5-methyltetrahydropteroyltriglutamate--homocysteine methyltransferase